MTFIENYYEVYCNLKPLKRGTLRYSVKSLDLKRVSNVAKGQNACFYKSPRNVLKVA